MVRTIIIAVAAAAFVAVASSAVAQGVSIKTSAQPHKTAAKHHPNLNGGAAPGYRGALGDVPDQSRRLDQDIEASRQAGGGGGGM